jgi:hypothetical protein
MYNRSTEHSQPALCRRWAIRICGRAWSEGGPGVAVAAITGGAPRVLVQRGEDCSALERELEAAIAGLEAASLDAALTAAPQDAWEVELRTASEAFVEMFTTRDIWTAPGRSGAYAGFAALRPVFERMTALIADIQEMGGTVAIARTGHSQADARDRAVAARARKELTCYLARRAAHVVRPLFADRAADPRSARFFEAGMRAGLRAAAHRAPAQLPATVGARGFYQRGLACSAAAAAL